MTPTNTMQRTTKLSQGYEDLKTDLLEEVNMVDTRIINPATEAKEWIQPLKKVIKKRQDRKVCFSTVCAKRRSAKIRSWTLKSIKRGSITPVRRRKGRTGTTHIWQRLRLNCITRKRYVNGPPLRSERYTHVPIPPKCKAGLLPRMDLRRISAG